MVSYRILLAACVGMVAAQSTVTVTTTPDGSSSTTSASSTTSTSSGSSTSSSSSTTTSSGSMPSSTHITNEQIDEKLPDYAKGSIDCPGTLDAAKAQAFIKEHGDEIPGVHIGGDSGSNNKKRFTGPELRNIMLTARLAAEEDGDSNEKRSNGDDDDWKDVTIPDDAGYKPDGTCRVNMHKIQMMQAMGLGRRAEEDDAVARANAGTTPVPSNALAARDRVETGICYNWIDAFMAISAAILLAFFSGGMSIVVLVMLAAFCVTEWIVNAVSGPATVTVTSSASEPTQT